MQADTLAPTVEAKIGVPQTEHLTWAVVELQVTDLDRAVAFWTAALGLYVREQSDSRVALGTQTRTLFVLHSGALIPVNPGHTGMYHVALSVPYPDEFSRLWARLIAMGVPVVPVDHLLSKSIYFSDPDGLEIEITLETPERFGRFGDMSENLVLYDADGRPHSGRERLDADTERVHEQYTDIETPLSEGALLAHLHLKVLELAPAVAWFKGMGFAENLVLPQHGYADMGAGAANTHRLAMNTWGGPNLLPTPNNMAGLIHYVLYAHGVMTNVRGLQTSDNGLTGRDPTGTKISLIPMHKKDTVS